jgi:RHH-type proline utilization regulon transcriptional repressor/proline dehydrogenase/delta 1-pyrroline-5-carboxylate dehydrogenase
VIDQRAMEMASQDAELRAALFRFVDVTPACRSLDDLARHLAGYLEEVDDRPPPIEAAMKISGTKPGRAALGAAAAAGVRHMAHRFIVGESPKAALKAIRHLWDNGAAVSLDLLGEATVTQAEADRYAAGCMDALETLAGAAPSWPERPGARGGLDRPAPAAVNLSVKVSALTPLLRPEAPEVGRDGRRRAGCGRCSSGRRSSAPILHIDMESVGHGGGHASGARRSCCSDEPELRPEGAVGGGRDPAYLARSRRSSSSRWLDWAAVTGAAVQPLVVELVQGANWDPREWCDASLSTLDPAVVRGEARLGPQLRGAHPPPDRGLAARAARRSRRTTCARCRTRWRSRASWAARTATWSSRCCAGSATTSPPRWPTSAIRVRIYCPVGDLVAGMAYLVRRLLENTANESFLGEQQRGTPIEELLAAP